MSAGRQQEKRADHEPASIRLPSVGSPHPRLPRNAFRGRQTAGDAVRGSSQQLGRFFEQRRDDRTSDRPDHEADDHVSPAPAACSDEGVRQRGPDQGPQPPAQHGETEGQATPLVEPMGTDIRVGERRRPPVLT